MQKNLMISHHKKQKKRLAVLLTKMDRNLDKSIDRNELYSWILRSFKSLSEEDSNLSFESSSLNELYSWILRS